MATARPATGAVRVAVADRRRLIADALASLIAEGDRMLVVAVASGELSAAAIAVSRPDVVLVGVDGDLAATLRIVDALGRQLPEARIALVADALSPALVGCTLERSLGGLLLTDYPAEDLVASIAHVARGQTVLPGGWQAQRSSRADPIDTLSERQLEVLRLLADGLAYEEIGARLFISVNTVKFHMRSIFERLGVHNRLAAVRLLGDSARGADG